MGKVTINTYGGQMTFHSFVRTVKNPFFLIIWLALMTGSYLFIDEQVAIFFHNFDQTHKTFTHIFDKITRAGVASIIW